MKQMKLAFLGAGNMAGAILGSIRGIVPDTDVTLFDRSPDAIARYADCHYHIAASAAEAVSAADCVVFAVKPQNIPDLLDELAASGVCRGRLLVTICAGVPIATFTDALGDVPVIRTMPNTPMLIGMGVTALCRNALVEDDAFEFVRSLFNAAGKTLVLDESEINRITSVTSSSPAYIFLIIKAICDSATAQGLSEEGMLSVVCDMVIGSATLLRDSGKTPDEMIAMVTSKKGTTEQAMLKLAEYKVPEAIHEAMLACTRRADELGRR